MWCALKEECYRNLKDMRNLLQPAGADAVGAFFVLLYLLEGQAESIPKLLLTHSDHHPPHANAAPHVLIDGVRSFLGHNDLLYPPHRPQCLMERLQTQSVICRRRQHCDKSCANSL